MEDRRVRVLWLIKGLGAGGAERLLAAQAGCTDHTAFHVSARYLTAGKTASVESLESRGVDCAAFASSINDLRWLWRLRRFVRRERVDVVHIHSPLVAAMARPLLRLMRHRPRVVYTEHNSWSMYRPLTRVANRLTYALNDAAVAVSRDAVESVRPVRLQRRVTALVHGIDVQGLAQSASDPTLRGATRRKMGWGHDDFVVMIVANHRPEKNYPLMIDVAARVAASAGNVRFVAAGQGPLEQRHSALVAERQMPDRFTILGFRDDVTDLLAAADLLFLGSDHEGMPVAVMEAFALGRPVVATAVGGLVDAVRPDVNGRLAARGDADALAAHIVAVATDPVLARRLGEGALAAAADYDVTRSSAVYERLYVGIPASR